MTQGGAQRPEGSSEHVDPSDVERTDGRPSGVPPATEEDVGRPEKARDTPGSESEPGETVAPEEKGAEPETEHAPGSDL